MLGCANFSDTIGVHGWPVEAHIAGDVKWVQAAYRERRGA